MQGFESTQLPQDRETTVRGEHGPAFVFRTAYARSADSRAANDVGQDYLILRRDESTLVFALCDGVSQSFFGDLAARFLGDALADWLTDNLVAHVDQARVQSALLTHLYALVGPATELVERHPLPEAMPPLVRDVLEEKRRTSGSQTTFVCGRLDHPSPGLPQGRVVLAWLGNSRLRVWGPGGEWFSELGTLSERQFWSSRRGPVNGEPNVFVGPLKEGDQPGITGLVAYSDGLPALDDYPWPPSNEVIQDLIDRASVSDTSDDISFLEIWPEPVPEKRETHPLILAPEIVAIHADAGRLRISWQPVPGATMYEVEIQNGEAATWQTSRTVWQSAPLPPETYRLRVRALLGPEPGLWSAARTATIRRAEKPEPVKAEPAKAHFPAKQRRTGRGVMWAALSGVVLLAAVLALTLPAESPFHRLVYGPSATQTPAVTSTLAPTLRPTPTASPAITSTPRPSPTSMPTATSPVSPTLVASTTPVATRSVEGTLPPEMGCYCFVGELLGIEEVRYPLMSIRGTVVDYLGRGVPDMLIEVGAHDWSRREWTDLRGAFQFDGLWRSSWWEVSLPEQVASVTVPRTARDQMGIVQFVEKPCPCPPSTADPLPSRPAFTDEGSTP